MNNYSELAASWMMAMKNELNANDLPKPMVPHAAGASFPMIR